MQLASLLRAPSPAAPRLTRCLLVSPPSERRSAHRHRRRSVARRSAVHVPQAAKGRWRRRLRGGGGGGAQLLAQVVELRAQIGEPAHDVHLGECSQGECSQGECSHSVSHAAVCLMPRGSRQRSKSHAHGAGCMCAVCVRCDLAPPLRRAPPRADGHARVLGLEHVALEREPRHLRPCACACACAGHAMGMGTPAAATALCTKVRRHSTLHSALCTLH